MSWDSTIPEVLKIIAEDSANLDAFSRWRSSNPVTIFDNIQQYGSNPFVWETQTSGTGNISNLLNESTVLMSTGGLLSGAEVVRSTRQYHRYQPGKSQLIFATFTMDDGYIKNVRRRVGYFDSNDGIFFELNGSEASVVIRTSTSGAPDDSKRLTRDQWLDPLDGTGKSGINLGEFDKSLIFVTDLQWLGVGRVRCYFSLDGNLIKFAEFNNANTINKVYMKSACLPLRYEIKNLDNTLSQASMRHICGSVISEGGFEGERGLQFSATRPASSLSINARRPVLAIRAKTVGPNNVRNIGQIIPKQIDLMSGTNSSIFEIILNPTTLLNGINPPNWQNVDNYSLTEYAIDSTVITGGTLIESGSIPAGSGSRGISESRFFRDLPIVYSSLLNIQDTLVIVVTPVSGSALINSSITWQEQY